MRIVSLLPSATESLFALGLGKSLVAVTHECDYPPEAASRPVVTQSTLRLEARNSAGIEAAVWTAATAGQSLYAVDTDAIQAFEPDLVVAQDVCRVCAVSADQVVRDLVGIRLIRQHPGVRRKSVRGSRCSFRARRQQDWLATISSLKSRGRPS